MKKLLALILTLVVLGSVAARAAAPAEPDPATNPALAGIQKAGAKLFYMGNRNGVDGWFIVKDGQVQVVYATPDNKGALVGVIFGPNGENVSSQQVKTLVENNKEIADIFARAQKEQAVPVGSPPAAAPAKPTLGGMPTLTLSPGERLMHDLGAATTIVVGNPATPELLMVMNPNCANCQATWAALRGAVTKGSLHLRLVPVGDKDSDNERAAAVLLTSTDALSAWDKYAGGDKGQLAGTPSSAALNAVRANQAVIDNWHLHSAPYLIYRAKDGKVKIVQGLPQKLSDLLSDLGL